MFAAPNLFNRPSGLTSFEWIQSSVRAFLRTCVFACIASLLLSTLADAQVTLDVGAKKFTENIILAKIAEQLVEATDIDAEQPTVAHRELGGTRLLWNALLAGEIDMYVDYTGTISHEILTDDSLKSPEEIAAKLKERGIVMLQPLGFNNTYAVGMLAKTADGLKIAKISDLAKHPDLAFGFSNEFMEREDGWPGLRSAYGLPQTDVQGLDHDLAYRGLEAGSIVAMDLYSTDSEIQYYGIKTLEDDKKYFPNYDAVILVRDDVPAEVIECLRTLEGAIDESSMIAMNARVKLDGESEAIVAGDFLQKNFGIASTAKVEGWWNQLARHTIAHLQLVAFSLLPAIVVAILLGVITAKVPFLRQPVLAIVGIIQTIPALALLVIMIPLLGIGSAPAIFALFLYSLLPIVRATHQGLTSIPPNLSESALALGLPAFERFRTIELPMAMPAIVSGIKVAAVLNIGFATLGALIGAGGYGQPILTGIRLDDMELILLGAIPSAVLALAVQWLFEWSEKWIVPKGLRL